MDNGNRKIVKNTALLYIRMLLSMGIGLYSVRIVLEALGETDFGVYNVVAGIVTMLAFLNNALSSTTQRFLSYESGRNNGLRLKDIFDNSMSLYMLLSLVILVLSETFGLWIVNRYLVIPPDRIHAANIIYQFSIISFIFSILVAPYNAAVIAREKMNVFAYVSIAESIIKLILVYCLVYIDYDKLILYGFMMMLVNFAVLAVYHVYCSRRFEECDFSWKLDKRLTKDIGAFAGWNVWGAFSCIFSNQGINILLNRFFGVIVNAARGIAYQVNGALNTCVQNFLIAVKPQLIKSYASGNYARMNELLILSTRASFYLMYVITIIFTFNIKTILKIWLGTYPEYTSDFVCLILVSTLINILAQPLVMLIYASGKIRLYQILSGVNTMLVFPVSYLLLKYTQNAYMPFFALIFSNLTYYLISLGISRKLVKFPLRQYGMVIVRILAVCLFSLSVLYIVPDFTSGIYVNLMVSALTTVLICACFIFIFDMSGSERRRILGFISSCKKL